MLRPTLPLSEDCAVVRREKHIYESTRLLGSAFWFPSNSLSSAEPQDNEPEVLIPRTTKRYAPGPESLPRDYRIIKSYMKSTEPYMSITLHDSQAETLGAVTLTRRSLYARQHCNLACVSSQLASLACHSAHQRIYATRRDDVLSLRSHKLSPKY